MRILKKQFRLNLITENQKFIDKENFAKLISDSLINKNEFKISKYHKFPNSYSFDFLGEINDPKNSISGLIELSDRICSPWIVTFDKETKEIELVFNKTDTSSFRDNKLNIINWGILEVIKE